ncbi:hypothetical protein TNCV_3732331 [Trichonephila clavipes]|nr:hypothetical protein TNCV_3732331 [Trichonephila clavipes]
MVLVRVFLMSLYGATRTLLEAEFTKLSYGQETIPRTEVPNPTNGRNFNRLNVNQLLCMVGLQSQHDAPAMNPSP